MDIYRNNKDDEAMLLPIYSDSQEKEISFVVKKIFLWGLMIRGAAFKPKRVSSEKIKK